LRKGWESNNPGDDEEEEDDEGEEMEGEEVEVMSEVYTSEGEEEGEKEEEEEDGEKESEEDDENEVPMEEPKVVKKKSQGPKTIKGKKEMLQPSRKKKRKKM
jgi:hypothetical protein